MDVMSHLINDEVPMASSLMSSILGVVMIGITEKQEPPKDSSTKGDHMQLNSHKSHIK